MVLETCITTHRVDYEVGVDVILVGVGCYYDFKARDLLRQLQGNLMCHLRGYRIIRTEGLNHVIVHPSMGAVVQPLGVHEFLQGALRYTIDTADQWTTLIADLGILTAVVDDGIETTYGLSAFAFHKMDDGHHFHRLGFRMSESKEPTCAYASVSS